MAMLALVARWLQPEPPGPGGEPVLLNDALNAAAAADAPVRLAEASAESTLESARRPSGVGIHPTGPRPISATLCHALDEKMKALHARAAGDLTRREMTALRTERDRVRDLQAGLRCRPGNVRYWF